MKKAIALLCLTMILSAYGYSQETGMKETFLAAESYFLFEEYDEALPLYLQIHRQYPDNDNINFKIGVCFLNDPYEKEKAIYYLEKAAENISPKYRQNSFKEKAAPAEALFYLGSAYRVNNQLTKAREYYHKFLNIMDPEVYDEQLVKDQLNACDAAEKLMKKPVDVDLEDLPGRINTRFAETNPVLSGDETKMAFISKLQFYDAIFYAEKHNGAWTAPRNIVPELGVDGDVYPTSMSFDGTEMFIYRNDNFIGNLYYTRLVNGRWTPLQKLNDHINTKYWESHASMSRDRKFLYFTSNRKGGYGGLDIYRSERQPNGDWGPAMNLGPVINSEYNEDTPFITENGKMLYFSSYGHYNMGGYDIFMSRQSGDTSWAKPVNLGYPINTTDDDQFFYPLKDGQVAYYPRFREGGYGKSDIYRYKIYGPDHPRMFPISGLLNYMGQKVDSSEVTIAVLESRSGDTMTVINPDYDGKFSFTVPAGDYNMIFNSERFKKHIQKLHVAATAPHQGILLPGAIMLEPMPSPLIPAEQPDLLTLRDSLITTDKEDKEVKIRFNAAKDSRAIVNIYHDSVLVKTDTLEVSRKRQSYEFTPLPGENEVVIKVEDENGNVTEKTARVILDTGTPSAPPMVTIPGGFAGAGLPQITAEATTQPEDYTGLFVNKLREHALGPLALVLDTLDLQKAGISTPDELTTYLKAHAGEQDYTPEDIRILLNKTVTEKTVDEFIRDMERVAEGNLKKYLGSAVKATDFSSPREVVDQLIQAAGSSGFNPRDVLNALGILASLETNDPFYLRAIMAPLSTDQLGDFLEDLDLNKAGIKTAAQLAAWLYQHAPEENYSTDDLLDILTSLAVARDPERLRAELMQLASGDLRSLLDTLDLPANKIFTAHDLTDFLYQNKYQLGYDQDAVNELLRAQIQSETGKIDDLRQKMAGLSRGALHQFLGSFDINSGDFASEAEFLDFLRNHADSLGFTVGDVNNTLLRLAYDSDLEDVIRKMAVYAATNLKNRLQAISPEEENIQTLDELIRNLFDHAEEYGYSREDVIKMLSDYITMSDLELFLAKMTELAEGNTRDFLVAIDTGNLDLHTRQELINYLLHQADQGNLDKNDIIHLILEARRIPVIDALSDLKALSDGELLRLLRETSSDVRYTDDLFTALLARAKPASGVTREEVTDLFSNYLYNSDLYLFRKQLTDHASGSLRTLLLETNPATAGIASVEDLIRYMLDQAEGHDYTREDVYTLLARIIGQNNLTRLMEQMKALAGPALRQALEDIDLDALNINSSDELIAYLHTVADRYGFDPAEIRDILLKIAIDQKPLAGTDKINLSSELEKSHFKRGLRQTLGILLIEGLIILILILLIRRKRKKKTENGERT